MKEIHQHCNKTAETEHKNIFFFIEQIKTIWVFFPFGDTLLQPEYFRGGQHHYYVTPSLLCVLMCLMSVHNIPMSQRCNRLNVFKPVPFIFLVHSGAVVSTVASLQEGPGYKPAGWVWIQAWQVVLSLCVSPWWTVDPSRVYPTLGVPLAQCQPPMTLRRISSSR